LEDLAALIFDVGILHSVGIIMILVGIMIVIAAFALLFISGVKGGKVRGGGAMIIGPFPIVFGTDEKAVKAVLWLSIALTVILFVVFITLYMLKR
jgi:uncharacterized membrane protein